MARKLGLWVILLGFIVYVFTVPLAQASRPLSLLNPVILSIFGMVGIWLLMYACLMIADGRMQRIPAWGFLVAAIASGVVGLIPYLALREPNTEFSGSKDTWISIFDARSTAIVLTLNTLFFLAFALLFGDWGGFVALFQTNRFVHAMTLAFCLFALLFPYPTLLSDDMARRGLTSSSQFFWWVALVPLFGPLAYLCLRPPLREYQTVNS